MAPPIQAVLFDYGLVLTGPPLPAAWTAMQQVFHAEEPAFSAAYWNHRLEYDRGSLTGQRYWQAVAADLHRKPAPAQVDELIALDTRLWTQSNKPMVDWALRLRAAGTPTGILSNLGDSIMDGVLNELPWMRGFDHHTFSHALGLVKPDPAIYAHAAAGLGVPPAAILFVDDREENIRGAIAAGLQAIQYTGHDQFLTQLETQHLLPLWLTGKSEPR